jgi:glucosamine--fructose-6-phosphate aminotransferase (isomerizing)
MMETPAIIRAMKMDGVDAVASAIRSVGKLFFTGEGSSRIFPAKNTMAQAMRDSAGLSLATEGGRQADEYDLSKFVVFGASNSGRTAEIIALFDKLKKAGHAHLYGLTASANSKLETLTKQTFVLSCGGEDAVAATKSVVEQALFYHRLLAKVEGRCFASQLSALADAFDAALSVTVPTSLVDAIGQAGTIYFAGRNDGVAEELTLKTNEITRRKSDFLEGTYALHGIEEVMNPNDVVIWIDPYASEFEKIQKTLVAGVGMKVFTISANDTPFTNIKLPNVGELNTYVQLGAGWNILVEIGLSLGINLDKPVRARKVGNEFTAG